MNLGSRLRQCMDFIRGRTHTDSAPSEWMVEVTNRCNLACPMCTRATVKFQQQDMKFELFERFLRQNPEVEAIWPYGFGEPLMHPRIFDFITAAKRHNHTVCLSTNAALLDQDNGWRLLQSRLDYLILPIDGVDKTTYEKNRYPAAFNKVEARVESFLALKLKLFSQLHITVQMIRMANNQTQIGTLRRRWQHKGVNVIRVRDDLSGNHGPASNHHRESSSRRPCFFLWRGPLFVQAACTVIPCPYYHGAEPVGDLRHQTAREIWASESMKRLRAAHLERRLSDYPICERCPRYQPHRLLGALSFFVTTWHIRRIFPALENLQRRLGAKFFE